MDQERFDELTRTLATGQSRRRVFGLLAGGLAVAFGGGRAAQAQKGGNSTAAKFCAQVFGAKTPAAGKCISDATKGSGPFVACGGNAARYCNGACVDLTTVTNCGSCNNVCSVPANAKATCTSGTCGFTCNTGYRSNGNGGCTLICDPAACSVPANSTANCTSGSCGFTCNPGYASDRNGGCAAFNGVLLGCDCGNGYIPLCLPWDEDGHHTSGCEACYDFCGVDANGVSLYDGCDYSNSITNDLDCVQ
jgi:hypothetical protein